MSTTLHKDLIGADLHINKIHADTHVAAGTDPLVLAESQVTDLVTDLSGKVDEGDARLTDARTPTAHTQAESTVTDLVADLAGKAAAVHTHVKADITDFPAIGAGTVTAVTGTSPIVSSEGATPAISLPAATNAAPGYATAAQIAALEAATAAQHAIATIGTGNGLSVEGQAISLAPATASVPGAATAAQITKLDGIAAGATANVGTVTGVTATAPVTSSGGAAPVIALPAATASVDGYATKEQVTKLDGIAAGATANVGTVTGVTGTAPVVSSGGAAPAISMAAATASVNGYATATQITKLDGIAAGANAYVHPNHSGDVTSTADGATVIGAAKVTLAMMANMATAELIGRATAGAGVPELIACTAAGRALIDDAAASDQRTTLSLGNVDNTSDATKNAAAVTVTNHRFTRRVDAQATTNDITPEISTYDIFIRTALAHALVINNHSTSTPVDGDMMLFEILSDATVRAITYGNKYVAKAGVALPAATVASKNLTLLFIWRVDLSQWVLLSAGQEA